MTPPDAGTRALPVFFNEGVHITPVEGEEVYWCRRCTLGVVMGSGAQPRCVRCGALSWTAFEEDVIAQREAWEPYSAGAINVRVVPPDAVVVPREPSEAMVEAAIRESVNEEIGFSLTREEADAILRAALSAAEPRKETGT